MAKLIYGLNQSLDGYVDHDRFGPDAVLFRHFIEHMGRVTGSLYGGRMYEIMRYWDEDQPEWSDAHWEYARAWRDSPNGSRRGRTPRSGRTRPCYRVIWRRRSAH